MKDFLFSGFGFNESGPLAALREMMQLLIKALGPLIEALKPLWDRLVAFLSDLGEQLAEQYEADQDRASWGKPELGWNS